MKQLENFISHLNQSFPENIDSNIVNTIKKSYFPLRKDNKLESGDLLIDFINNYRTEDFILGGISLLDSVNDTKLKEFYIVGAYEGCLLVISKKNNEVIILDENSKPLYYCAKNSVDFLYNLIKVSAANFKEIDDNEKEKLIKNELATNENQIQFYETLLGYGW